MSRQWKLVPVEPTETMVINGFESEPDECFSDEEVWEQYKEMSGCQQAAFRAKLCWAAMLKSAPAPDTHNAAPEDSAGVDFGIDGRSVRVSQEAYSIFLAREAAGREKIEALQQRLNAADQRIDEMTAPIPDEPVTWGSPKTVRQLVHQLLMLDQDLEPWAMHRIPDFKDGKQVAAVHLSMSYERVEGRFLSDFKGDGRKIIAFWCKPDPRAEHPTLVAEKLVTRLAEEFPDSDTLLTVECVADLIKEYLTGL